MSTWSIRPAALGDVDAMTAIYNDVLATTAAIWSEEPTTREERVTWLEAKLERGDPVLVAASEGALAGFVAAGPFRPWPGYARTYEHSIHVERRARGAGIGTRLLSALEAELAARAAHVMVAAIDGENVGSIRFHERAGFVEVGRMAEVGWLRGTWRELVLMQKVLKP